MELSIEFIFAVITGIILTSELVSIRDNYQRRKRKC
jgi:hypothetical protein